MDTSRKKKIEQTFDSGISDYIQERYARIDTFTRKLFSFKGALGVHRKALGRDLIRVPLNIAWAVPYIVVRTGSFVLRKTGLHKAVQVLDKMPSGIKTEIQKEVEWLIYTDLLELPFKQGQRQSTKDMLLASILDQQAISEDIHLALVKIGAKAEDHDFKQALTLKLKEYGTSRTAIADLSGNILMLASGYLAFQKATPGALSGGTALATVVAQQIAISNSWWPVFYSFWYSLFPVTPSFGLIAASTGILMAGLAVLTTFSGIVADPIQARLGIHQKRLRKLVAALETELRGETKSDYKLREIYLARIFDFLDILRTASKLA
jgi:hypothetical protein